MRIKIKRKRKSPVEELPPPLPVEPIVERYTVQLGNISEDKVVALLKHWRSFLHTLSNDDKKIVRKWACGDGSGCSPEEINRWAKATKGSLD
jgi:hypothetical protein